MKTFLECVPCFIKQTLAASHQATADPAVHEQIMRTVLQEASALPFSQTPVHMGETIHRIIRRLSGNPDPYRELKDHFNQAALDLLPDLTQRIAASSDRFATAVRLAIAGNIIDFGVGTTKEDIQLHATVEDTLTRDLAIDHLERLRRACQNGASILYLADNTGEIVLDRLLVAELPADRVCVAVKSGPVINDATLDDARAAGLTDMVEVIENGTAAPGTILDTCSDAFRKRFDQAEVVIAKGQGNYETLSAVNKDGLFFLLKAKCPVIARDLGCAVGDIVIKAAEA